MYYKEKFKINQSIWDVDSFLEHKFKKAYRLKMDMITELNARIRKMLNNYEMRMYRRCGRYIKEVEEKRKLAESNKDNKLVSIYKKCLDMLKKEKKKFLKQAKIREGIPAADKLSGRWSYKEYDYNFNKKWDQMYVKGFGYRLKEKFMLDAQRSVLKQIDNKGKGIGNKKMKIEKLLIISLIQSRFKEKILKLTL